MRERPDAVILTSYVDYTAVDSNANASAVVEGVAQAAKRIVAVGVSVLLIKTGPILLKHVPDCLAKEVARKPGSADLSACSTGKERALRKRGPADEAAAMYPAMRRLSFDDVFCENDPCLPVIGNVVAYRDMHQLTKEFARSLAPALEKRLVEALPFLESAPE